ncbi:MAG: crossover junction endodeoxyribonuclease RuvC [Patescibacteria group bacterium]|mgnify:CR=1 FL=1
MIKNKKSLPLNPYPLILGVDPGYGRIGLAIVEKNKLGEKLIHSECFETDKKLEHPKRLSLIGNRVEKIIKKFLPQKVAIEGLLWSKNVKTAIGVAEARGVILARVADKKIPVFEFNPNSIKLAVTGYGKSDKKQIINMINKIIKINKKIEYDDEYDAIAVALTAIYSTYPQ